MAGLCPGITMTRLIAFAAAIGFWPKCADAGCLFLCRDNGELSLTEAAEVFTGDLGKSLPSGVTVLGMIDGGFQDRFVQVKLGSDTAGAIALMAALRADPARALPPGTAQTTVASADWWDIDTHPDLVLFEARLGRFPHVIVGRAADPEDPARWLIYVFAFET